MVDVIAARKIKTNEDLFQGIFVVTLVPDAIDDGFGVIGGAIDWLVTLGRIADSVGHLFVL